MTAAAHYIHPRNAVTYLSIPAGLLAIVAARDARSWSLARSGPRLRMPW